VHVTDEVLEPVRRRFGVPATLEWVGEISDEEWRIATHNPERTHDVTLFVLDPDGRLALIRKPHFTPGVWRPPGGGIRPGEDFVAGAAREAHEETGLGVELCRYLVATQAVFRNGDRSLPWRTHVLLAAAGRGRELTPTDTAEIAAARWGTLDELGGPLRERLLETGRAFWRYRVALHDAAMAQIRRGDSPR
jgi:ADP-ribose pyrophosphatase YjhB (NUDIX family)